MASSTRLAARPVEGGATTRNNLSEPHDVEKSRFRATGVPSLSPRCIALRSHKASKPHKFLETVVGWRRTTPQGASETYSARMITRPSEHSFSRPARGIWPSFANELPVGVLSRRFSIEWTRCGRQVSKVTVHNGEQKRSVSVPVQFIAAQETRRNCFISKAEKEK